MRTKTLLIAAAALAATVISTEAQVYSANVVGYVNVATPTGGNFYLLTVPFNIGSSNGANEIFGTNLNTGDQFETWDVGSQSYVISFYDATTTPPWWDSADENYNVPAPTLKPGQGFFYSPYNGGTNTVAGVVPVAPGTNTTISMSIGGNYYLVGSPVPYSGAVTNGTSAGAGANLNGLDAGSLIETWDVGSQSYVISFYDSGTTPPWWDSADENYNVPAPSVGVAEGFFVSPFDAYTWTNGLSSN